MKRGSALLIVLGMMAFMVISAVAFSAWMRYERLPNSYLRRASSSRLLVKAALAEAIDQIDAAIGENAHPNVGTVRPRQGVGAVASDNQGVQNENLDNRNVWAQRVYLGTNSIYNLASVDSTVSTLTFEGLAYIPPPLVNYARYYSRRSTAGQWKNLGFDSGRYAFCAIDVSDYLDVNMIAANFGRGSSPATRLSLAHLFETTSHEKYETDPVYWDTFMKNFWKQTAAEAAIGTIGGSASRTDPSKVPLVSLADFNLALYDKKPGLFKSPFCEYVKNGYDAFYNNRHYTSEKEQDDDDFIHRMTFVTDSYFPPEGGGTIDLATEAGQPFTRNMLQGANPDYGTVMNNAAPAAVALRDRISKLGLVMLYDYLDDDSIPVSLSIPSVERIPMIAGFQPNFSAANLAAANPAPGNEYCVQTGGAKPASGSTATTQITMQQATVYKLDAQRFSTPGSVKVVATYPFRRGCDLLGGAPTFKVDGLVEYFFTSEDMRFRPDDGGGFLHPVVRNNRLEPENPCDGVFSAQLSESDFRPSNANPQSEEDPSVVKELTLETQGAAQALYNAVDQRPLLTVVKEWTENWVDNGNGSGSWVKDTASEHVVQQMADNSARTVCGIVPLKANGSLDASFSNPNTVAGWLQAGKTIHLKMAVWLRVRDENNKTVDLVPACMADDKTANGQNDNNDMSMGPEGAVQLGGRYPIMRFDGADVTLGMNGLTFADGNSSPFNLAPTAVMCPDPRWNWAPEHWFAPAGGAMSTTIWLQECGKDTNGRDCDIFMATSDAGYMQSVYELAFLPRVTGNDDGTPLRSDGQFGNVDNPNDDRLAWATAIGGVRNERFMWKTYRCFNHGGLRRDDLEEIGLVSQGGGAKLNPYSDSTNVMMCAFANTPLDWWCAASEADTDVGVPFSDRGSATTFNRSYAFSAMNSPGKFAWKALQKVAGNFMDCVRRRVPYKLDSSMFRAWEEVFDGTVYDRDGNPLRDETVPQGQYLDWDGENSWFCGVQDADRSPDGQETDELFDVDRKFLYGYWRECFAPQQQLFLIFVRAEPAMMGGGAAGRTPPQLGARAVALVWRDPYPSGENLKPHRTRVLFYRQFD